MKEDRQPTAAELRVMHRQHLKALRTPCTADLLGRLAPIRRRQQTRAVRHAELRTFIAREWPTCNGSWPELCRRAKASGIYSSRGHGTAFTALWSMLRDRVNELQEVTA